MPRAARGGGGTKTGGPTVGGGPFSNAAHKEPHARKKTAGSFTFLFIQTDHGIAFLWLALQSLHQTLRLPDSASIFTAEICVIIKTLEQIKDSVASKYIIYFRLTFLFPSFTIYEAGTFIDYW